jgi:serine/threonine protein phosphatase PrpC
MSNSGKQLPSGPADWQVEVFGLKWQGRRPSQQDFWLAAIVNGQLVVLVADGAGGPPAGDVAALTALQVIGAGCLPVGTTALVPDMVQVVNCESSRLPAADAPLDEVGAFMRHLFEAADEGIKQVGASDNQKTGLLSACCMMLQAGDRLHFFNAADVRGSRFDGVDLVDMTLDQVTKKHRHVATTILGGLGPQRVLPMTAHQSCGLDRLTRRGTGIALLCTDGVHTVLDRHKIAAVLREGGSAEELCRKLMAALEQEAEQYPPELQLDNATIVVVTFRRQLHPPGVLADPHPTPPV